MVRLVRVVAPDSTARLELRARVPTRYSGNAVLRLTRVRGGAEIDVEIAGAADHERMHWVIAGCWQATENRLWCCRSAKAVRRKRVAHDLRGARPELLGVYESLVE